MPAGELNHIRGTVVVRSSTDFLQGCVQIPSFEEVKNDSGKFNEAFRITCGQQNPFSAQPLVQGHGDRFVIHFPPPLPMDTEALDTIYELPYERAWHPVYAGTGWRAGTGNRAVFPGVSPGMLRRMQLLLAQPSPGKDSAEQKQGITGARGAAAFSSGMTSGERLLISAARLPISTQLPAAGGRKKVPVKKRAASPRLHVKI